MEQQYLITVDIGTTSTKTISFSTQGEIIEFTSRSYKIITPELDFAEQDPYQILEAVKTSIKEIKEKTKGTLIGVSFSCAMHSLILMDKNGNPLTNAIIWADNRSKKEASEINFSKVGRKIYTNTGTPIHPMSPLCKILWFKRNMTSHFNATSKFISIKEFIFFNFFGNYVVDYSIASATGLFDINNLTWYLPSLQLLGISGKLLSKPVPTTHSLTGLKDDIKKELGLPENTPFIVGASDGCLANLGADAISTGRAAVTIGTSGAVRVACTKPANDKKERIFNYLLSEKVYIIGGAVNNGAITLDWFRSNFLENSSTNLLSFNEEIEADIKEVPPGSDGLIFLPYLLGERAPIWNPDAKGVFFGIKTSHTKSHFTRAIMEGVIFNLYSIIKIIEEQTQDVEEVTVSGGFASSEIWVQMLADIFNKKVVIKNSKEGSSLGAAIIGFQALGIVQNLQESKRFLQIKNLFNPDREKHLSYKKNYSLFLELYENLREVFNKLD